MEKDTQIVPENAQQLVPTQGDPTKVLAFAKTACNALKDIISNKQKPVIINGEQYLEFEDWQTVARFYGATVGTEWTKEIRDQDNKIIGYEAKAIVHHNGQVISSAEGMCLNDEPKWKGKPMFSIRSMAQTRACAKALRNVFSWVVVLAGYKATPAEEMDGVIPQKTAPEGTQTAPRSFVPGKLVTQKQVNFLANLGRRLGYEEGDVMTMLETKAGKKFSKIGEVPMDIARGVLDDLFAEEKELREREKGEDQGSDVQYGS